jgi:hypothetical protein
MNYIPYPREDKDSHSDLIKWRANASKKDGDWIDLKSFLHECTKILDATDALPKCWYSELPQGDDYALDVEHFRPKGSGDPLTNKHIKEIEKLGGVKFEQETSSGSYSWLEFDYRNYRLVTATPNRAGAKHIYFPIAKGTIRLSSGQYPWDTNEYPYFLDPTDKEDVALLFVKPNGEIAPITPRTELTVDDYSNLPRTWKNNGFNYLRAIVTIKMYRLNDTRFIQGRKKVFDDTLNELENLDILFSENPESEVIHRIINKIVQLILPSAPFSLAAKSAIKTYHAKRIDKSNFETIKSRILNKVDIAISQVLIDWNKL